MIEPSSVLVIIPTYNERAALPQTLADLRAVYPHIDVLVVDDASPDGTGQWAQEHSAGDKHLNVLHRKGKEGLGPAYLAGFTWAMERGFEALVEMDADGSHQASDLPKLLEAAQRADLVIGSRWIPGGAVQNWSAHRRWLSRSANRYTKAVLGLDVRDATAGFRLYRSAMLRQIDLAGVESAGYCFQIDLTWRVVRASGAVVEVPITFVERRDGVSKMDRSIVLEALWRVTTWGVSRRWRQLRGNS